MQLSEELFYYTIVFFDHFRALFVCLLSKNSLHFPPLCVMHTPHNKQTTVCISKNEGRPPPLILGIARPFWDGVGCPGVRRNMSYTTTNTVCYPSLCYKFDLFLKNALLLATSGTFFSTITVNWRFQVFVEKMFTTLLCLWLVTREFVNLLDC